MFTSTPSPLFHQLDLSSLHFSGRLLLHNPLQQTPPASASPPTPETNPVDPTAPYNGTNGFDANLVMILSVLLCALIFSLGLNSIIKCALRFASTPTTTDSNPTGIKRKALKTFAVVNYSPDLKLPGIGTECVICLSEFTLGERVRILPKCNHGFHVRCIDKWLNSHSSCPTCRHCLIEACQKIVGGCDQASSSQTTSEPQLTQETVINIVPLEREDLTRSYRCDS